MSVKFRIRRTDLKRFRTLLEREKPEPGKQWIVFLEITQHVGIFRVGKVKAEYPVDGASQGFGKVPEESVWRILRDVFDKRKTGEVEIVVNDGYIRCESNTVSDCDISVGYIRNALDDRVTYMTTFDLVVLGRTLETSVVAGVELKDHIKEAAEHMQRAISSAAGTLSDYGVKQGDVVDLIEKSIESAKPKIKARLGL